jgi:hypothetical protein
MLKLVLRLERHMIIYASLRFSMFVRQTWFFTIFFEYTFYFMGIPSDVSSLSGPLIICMRLLIFFSKKNKNTDPRLYIMQKSSPSTGFSTSPFFFLHIPNGCVAFFQLAFFT